MKSSKTLLLDAPTWIMVVPPSHQKQNTSSIEEILTPEYSPDKIICPKNPHFLATSNSLRADEHSTEVIVVDEYVIVCDIDSLIR